MIIASESSSPRGLRLALTLVVLALGAAALTRADEDVINADLAGLGSSDPDARESAIASLASQGTSAVASLQSSLEVEPSPLVKAGVAEAIFRIGPSDSQVQSLASSLRAQDVSARIEAARLLGRTKPSLVRSSLAAVLADRSEDAEVRSCAAAALGRAGAQAAAALSATIADAKTPASVRAAAFHGLALTGTEGAGSVAAVATSGTASAADRRAARAALSDPDAPAEDALVALLTASAKATRLMAIDILVVRGGGTTASRAALAGVLSDGAADVRRAAVDALVALGGASGNKDAILAALSDGSEAVVIAAARAIGRGFRDAPTDVVNPLAALLTSSSFAVRMHAALALAELHDSRGATTMTADAASEDASQQAMATTALTRIQALTAN